MDMSSVLDRLYCPMYLCSNIFDSAVTGSYGYNSLSGLKQGDTWLESNIAVFYY